MPRDFDKPKDKEDTPNQIIETDENQGRVFFRKENSKVIHYFLDISKQTKIEVNLAYFPAWHFYLDGKKVTPRISKGRVSFAIEPGRHELYAEFIQTPLEKLSNALSLTGLFMLILGIIFFNGKITYGRKST